jgi:hypothetical protein
VLVRRRSAKKHGDRGRCSRDDQEEIVLLDHGLYVVSYAYGWGGFLTVFVIAC